MSRLETTIDSELIERCLAEDQAAWMELVHLYQRLVHSVARSLCRRSEDVPDVFQQVWMELYQRLPALRCSDALPAWLITVTRRQAYALMTKQHPEPLHDELEDETNKLVQIEREHAVERALSQIPERCRRLIDLLYFDIQEPSYDDIAQKMGMPVSSIGPTRARCLERLRKLIG